MGVFNMRNLLLIAAFGLLGCVPLHKGSVVMLLSFTRPGGGTGFQVKTEDGHEFLVTNDHVCESADAQGSMYALDEEGNLHDAVVRYRSETTDLCFMQAIDGLTPFQLAPESTIGTKVRALGHPSLQRLTESVGKSLKRDTIEVGLGFGMPCDKQRMRMSFFGMCMERVNAIESDAYIEPGSSGSPALDPNDKVVGVFFASGRGRSFYIPVEDLRNELVKASNPT